MKSLNVITIFKESKALFLFVLFSIITHTSVFLINPTFSFSFSDGWKGQKAGLLMVELRKRKAPDLPPPGAAKNVSGFKNEKRGDGSSNGLKSQLPGPSKAGAPPKEGSRISKRNKPATASKDRKGDTGPLQSVQGDASVNEDPHPELTKKAEELLPLPAENKGEGLNQQQNVASVKEEDARGDVAKPLMHGGEDPSPSSEEGKPKEPEITDDAPQPKAAAVNLVDQPLGTAPAQPPTDPRNEEVAKADVKENAAEPSVKESSEPVKPEVLPPAGVEATPTASEERVETHISQGLTKVDGNQPHPHLNPLPEGEDAILPSPLQGEGRGGDGVFSGQNEIEIKETERTEEDKSEVMISEGSQPHPHPAPLPEVEGNPGVQMNVKVEATEKEKEPLKVIEPKVETRIKKKNRSIPLHKMLEPEKDPMGIGIPFDRPMVKIITPSKRKVGSRVQRISGRMGGNGVSRVILTINGDNFMIPGQNGRFSWDGVLKEGKNIISAAVWDRDGYSAMDRVDVEVLPSKDRFGLFIDEPGSGELDSGVAMVKGRVEDAGIDTVRVILNGESMEASVEDGGFEKTVLFKEGENLLEAEATNSGGSTARSSLVKVMAKEHIPSDIQIRLMWEDMDAEFMPSLVRRERAQLENEKAASQEIGITELMSASEGYREKVFAAEEGSGVYTLSVSGDRGGDCTLVVTFNSSKRRVFEKRMNEGDVWVVGRFLMPEGVFWDEDEWFSGRIEDKDSITKYKSPEGVTWKELKEGY